MHPYTNDRHEEQQEDHTYTAPSPPQQPQDEKYKQQRGQAGQQRVHNVVQCEQTTMPHIPLDSKIDMRPRRDQGAHDHKTDDSRPFRELTQNACRNDLNNLQS